MKDLTLVVAGGAIAAYFLYRNAGNIDFTKKVDEINKKPLDRPDPSMLLDVEAAAIAERQHKAMNRPGYDRGALFGSIQNLNGAELRQVYEQYGTRKFSWFVGDRDLLQWYVLELSPSDLQRMRIIWFKAGLTF